MSIRNATASAQVAGHGTRDRQGVNQFLELVKLVQEATPRIAVEAGFLELATPTIGEGLRAIARRGARKARVMPLLLFAAGHVKEDIPAVLTSAARDLPQNSRSPHCVEDAPRPAHSAVAKTETIRCEYEQWR